MLVGGSAHPRDLLLLASGSLSGLSQASLSVLQDPQATVKKGRNVTVGSGSGDTYSAIPEGPDSGSD